MSGPVLVGEFTRRAKASGNSGGSGGAAGRCAVIAFDPMSPITSGALLGDRLRGRDVAIGGTLAFSLALGSLFLTISTRFAGQAVNILFGNILAIATNDVRFVAAFAAVALCAVGIMFRPLLFASVDAEVADARGVPVRLLSVAFMVLLAITVSALSTCASPVRDRAASRLSARWPPPASKSSPFAT